MGEHGVFQRQTGSNGADPHKKRNTDRADINREEEKAQALSDLLLTRGVFAQSIVYPTVAQGKARIRTIITAEHTNEELDRALEVIRSAAKELQLV